MIPIAGASKRRHAEEAAGALKVQLSADYWSGSQTFLNISLVNRGAKD